MSNRFIQLTLIVLILSACAPKYNYVNTQAEQPVFDHIVVVFDYLHLVDDVGKLFDYPEHKNQQQIQALETRITTALREQGYTGIIEFALISSGLGLNPATGFEHYLEDGLQEALIYPPFYLATDYDDDSTDALIQSFADAQQLALAPVSKKNAAEFQNIRMNQVVLNEIEAQAVTGKVGVLHIRAVMPRVSFMKAMGVSLLTVGLTAGATGGAYVGIATPVGTPHSTGLLFDNSNGQIIWKNQTAGDLSRFGPQAHKRFFKDFPDLSK